MQAIAPYAVAIGLGLVVFVVIAAVVLSFRVLRQGGECEVKAKVLFPTLEWRVSKDEGPGLESPPRSNSVSDTQSGP